MISSKIKSIIWCWVNDYFCYTIPSAREVENNEHVNEAIVSDLVYFYRSTLSHPTVTLLIRIFIVNVYSDLET